MIHGLVEPDMQLATKDSRDSQASHAIPNLCNNTLGLSISDSDREIQTHTCKFISIRTQKMVYGARSALKKTQIYINEHLTANSARIFAKTRQLTKEGKATASWSAGGTIFLRLSEEPGSKPLRISCLNDLDKLFPSMTTSLAVSPEVGSTRSNPSRYFEDVSFCSAILHLGLSHFLLLP